MPAFVVAQLAGAPRRRHAAFLRPYLVTALVVRREGVIDDEVPSVLFLCVHNAGRSQMASAWLEHLAAGRAVALSGGSEPAAEVNPRAVEAMAEVGIDITSEVPKRWSDADLDEADVVVTMGCGDSCPFIPGKRYEDWEVDDPADQPIERVREIRDDIERRVEALLASIGVARG